MHSKDIESQKVHDLRQYIKSGFNEENNIILNKDDCILLTNLIDDLVTSFYRLNSIGLHDYIIE